MYVCVCVCVCVMCIYVRVSSPIVFSTNIAIDMYQILPVTLSIYQVPSDGFAVWR